MCAGPVSRAGPLSSVLAPAGCFPAFGKGGSGFSGGGSGGSGLLSEEAGVCDTGLTWEAGTPRSRTAKSTYAQTPTSGTAIRQITRAFCTTESSHVHPLGHHVTSLHSTASS